MKIDVLYIYPQVRTGEYDRLARRFVEKWKQFRPNPEGMRCYVIFNGDRTAKVPPVEFPPEWTIRPHDNTGWDIGAYQLHAAETDADLMICIGGHGYPFRPDWWSRIMQVYLQWGPAAYSGWGFGVPNTHLRTTVFWAPPFLIRQYPVKVKTPQERYLFEHGSNNFTLWCERNNFRTAAVNACRLFLKDEWPQVEFPIAANLFGDKFVDFEITRQKLPEDIWKTMCWNG